MKLFYVCYHSQNNTKSVQWFALKTLHCGTFRSLSLTLYIHTHTCTYKYIYTRFFSSFFLTLSKTDTDTDIDIGISLLCFDFRIGDRCLVPHAWILTGNLIICQPSVVIHWMAKVKECHCHHLTSTQNVNRNLRVPQHCWDQSPSWIYRTHAQWHSKWEGKI